MILIKTILALFVMVCAAGLMFEDDMIEQVQIQEGSVAKLRCIHYGNPSNTLSWIFKTKANIKNLEAYDPIKETELKYFDSINEGFLKFRRTEHTLTLPCVTKSLEGEIICSQYSQDGDDDHHPELLMVFNLSIANKAKHLSSMENCDNNVKIGSQPDIHLNTLSIIDHEGDDTILQCRAHGNPKPHIQWFDPKGYKVKLNQKGYQVFSNGDLLIRQLDWERDRGNYKCVAINKYGKDSSEVFVYPADKKKSTKN